MNYTFQTRVVKCPHALYTKIKCVELNKECQTKNTTVNEAMTMLQDFIRKNYESR